MNTTKRMMASVLALVSFATTASAQEATATGTATATIVDPIAITSTRTLHFGNIAVLGSNGTVVMDPAGARTKTGGVTLPSNTGTPTSGEFEVTGQKGYTYTITLPTGSVTLTHTVTNTNTMAVSDFTKSIATGTLDASTGSQKFTVGATLSVAANQAPGSYSGTYTVSVNYN